MISGSPYEKRQEGQSQRRRYEGGNRGPSDVGPRAEECRQVLPEAGSSKEASSALKPPEGTLILDFRPSGL